MTPHDNYLLRDADGPEPLDEEALQDAINDVGARLAREFRIDELVQAVYDAAPAIFHALCKIEFPQHLRAEIVRLHGFADQIRAEVDDDYKARTTTFDDPRD